MKKKGNFFLLLAISASTIGSLTSVVEKLTINLIDSSLPNASQINLFSRPGTITILSKNHKVLKKLGPTSREKIKPGSIPPKVKQAFIAAEDRRFYKHNGVDVLAITRAVVINIKNRSILEGGSTITQQLARIIFLNQDRTLVRKAKEIALAYKLERQLDKNEILRQYINNVYLGSNAYGIADASWIYFSKSPSSLTLGEAALIAGLAPAPSIYSPLVNIELALKQQAKVLKKMKLEGFISEEEFTKALISPLTLKPAKPKFSKSEVPFFTSWVEQTLPKLLSQEELEIGGISIHTSLNLKWQNQAQQLIKNETPNEIEGAIVAIEPSTGLIRVLVGGKDFETNEFNRATQALRSPGSTFKIFPYAAAIQKGYKPEDLLFDTPRCWYGYCPKNFGDLYFGEVSLTEAFQKSLNTVAIDLLNNVGFKDVISIANKLGVGDENGLGEYYSLGIGSHEETVLNMTGAYAGITNRGIYMKPSPIEEIIGPKKQVIWSKEKDGAKGVKVISIKVADVLNRMLQKVVIDGTGEAAFIKGIQIAGKTGTSEGDRDLWFIGSVPELTVGVWLGNDDNSPTNGGSSDAALMWKKFILRILEDLPTSNSPPKPKS